MISVPNVLQEPGCRYFARAPLARGGGAVGDVGAHCGLFALYCSLRVGSGTRWSITCLEPNPESRRACKVNLGRYLDAFVLLPYAAGDSDRDDAALSVYPRMPGNSTLRPREKNEQRFLDRHDLFQGATSLVCQERKLDTLLTGPLSLLKIDVEGHEVQALSSVDLSKVHIDIIISENPRVAELLLRNGYRLQSSAHDNIWLRSNFQPAITRHGGKVTDRTSSAFEYSCG